MWDLFIVYTCLLFAEIVDGNLKMTLGMIWTIILRFAIQDISVEGNTILYFLHHVMFTHDRPIFIAIDVRLLYFFPFESPLSWYYSYLNQAACLKGAFSFAPLLLSCIVRAREKALIGMADSATIVV